MKKSVFILLFCSGLRFAQKATYDGKQVTVTSTRVDRHNFRITRTVEVVSGQRALHFVFFCHDGDAGCSALGVGTTYKLIGNPTGGSYHGAPPSNLQHSCRRIAISLIDTEKGEWKAQTVLSPVLSHLTREHNEDVIRL
jgi:hypothetical protein